MRAIDVARREKTITDGGKWTYGKMTHAAFPLSRNHGYRLGQYWNWRVIELELEGALYRLLVAYEPRKLQYRAWLGLVKGDDQILLARLEYHPDHLGWHCHMTYGELEKITPGVVKRHTDRLKACPDKEPFQPTDMTALNAALRVFRMVPAGDEASLL